MTQQHTPGPWSQVAYDQQTMAIAGSNRKTIVCKMPTKEGLTKEDRRTLDANFDLITATPKLLKALEEIAKGEGRFNRDPYKHAVNTIEDMQEIARAAIAETKGEIK